MSKYTSIVLDDHFDKFVKSEIESGRYTSASEVIRMALRLLELENQKINAINNALIIGEQSGTPVSFDNEEFKKRMKRKLILDA